MTMSQADTIATRRRVSWSFVPKHRKYSSLLTTDSDRSPKAEKVYLGEDSPDLRLVPF